MGQWKDLPFEIVLRIVDDNNLQYGREKWMHVNKQLYIIHLLSEFKDIFVDFNNPLDKDLNAIFKSVFEPGKYVNSISFSQLETPDNLKNLDPTSDPLHELMKHCPNAEHVDFEFRDDGYEYIKKWTYFSIALLETSIWKLKSLPSPRDKNMVYAIYFNFACYLRNSLVELYVGPGMISRYDYGRLAEFKQLTELNIGENVLRDLYDCDTILKWVPHLEKFHVEGFQVYDNMDLDDTGRDNNDDAVEDSSTYDQLKSLTISNYVALKDEELLSIMDKYTGVEKLSIAGALCVSWPLDTISAPVMISFMKFALNMKLCYFNIASVSGESWLMHSYHISQRNLDRDRHKVELSINFLDVNCSFKSNAEFQFSICNYSPDIVSLEITYDNPIKQRSRVNDILLGLHKDVQSVKINLDGHDEEHVGGYIDALLSTTHVNLRCLEINRGIFHTYNSTQDLQGRAQYMTKLEFENTHIAGRALRLLSDEFPQLERLKFDDCIFDGDDGGDSNNNMEIFMMESAIKKLEIHRGRIENESPVILVSLVLADQDCPKYYINLAPNSTTDETNAIKFEVLKQVLKPENIVMISVRTKSLKNFVFTSFDMNYRDHDIELSLS